MAEEIFISLLTDAHGAREQPALEMAHRLARFVSARAGDALAHHDVHARLVGGRHLDDAQLEQIPHSS